MEASLQIRFQLYPVAYNLYIFNYVILIIIGLKFQIYRIMYLIVYFKKIFSDEFSCDDYIVRGLESYRKFVKCTESNVILENFTVSLI